MDNGQTLLFTVVVTVYNTQPYLKQCLDSLIAYTNPTDSEIVLVDDGSSDASLQVCYAYQRQYPHIKVISNGHEGVSKARNLGLENARGKYILFLDSDDWWETSITNQIYACVKHNYDFIYLKKYAEYNEQTKKISYKDRGIEITSGDDFKAICQKVKDGKWSICSCIYKREIIERYNILFPISLAIGEDAVFFLTYCQHIHSATTIDGSGYMYRVNRKGSTMSEKNINLEMQYGQYLIEALKVYHANASINRKYVLEILCSNYITHLKYIKKDKTGFEEMLKELIENGFCQFIMPTINMYWIFHWFGLKTYTNYMWIKFTIKQRIKSWLRRWGRGSV